MKEIVISSKYRIGGSNENFTVEIPYCREIKLHEAYIPISFFNILAGDIIINGTNSGTSTISIPDGRYTIDSLKSYLQTQFTAIILSETYTITYDLINRFTISSTETFTADFTSFPFLGFDGVTGLSSSIIGTSITAIISPPYALLKSTDVLGYDNGPMLIGSGITGIIHTIPICGCDDFSDYRASPEAPWVKIIKSTNYTPTITLNVHLDILGRSLNSAEWTIKLLIK